MTGGLTRFAHPAEAQLAALLDAYGVRWSYEPRTFVLASDAWGRPLQAFTPDFYLPDFDLYLEVTTLRPALVTAKRRKIRRLAVTDPEVRVQLVDRRAYRDLVARFGLADHAGAPAAITPLVSQPRP